MPVTVVWTREPGQLHRIALASVALATGTPRESLTLVHACGRCGSSQHGRPVVVGAPDTCVSLSRCRDVGIVAISVGQPVGVDIESVPSAGDLSRWVRIEAVLKMIGTGLAVDPSEVEIESSAGVGLIRRWPAGEPRPDCVVLDLAVGPGHVAAVATPGHEAVVSRRWGGSGA